MISASSLVRCGWLRKLKKEKKRTPSMEVSCARGAIFHNAIEQWGKTGVCPDVEDMEIQGWIDLLRSQWAPHPYMLFEEVLGLGFDGHYIAARETEPHVYVALYDTDTLVTAGRADVVWYDQETDCVHVLDWKTGVWPVEHPRTNLQLWSLGLAARHRFKARHAQVHVYYARDGVFEDSEVIDYKLDPGALWERIGDVERAALLEEVPVPGEQCLTCWERKKCKFAPTV